MIIDLWARVLVGFLFKISFKLNTSLDYVLHKINITCSLCVY